MSRRKTLEEILEDFHKAHGDRYDYVKSITFQFLYKI